MKRVVQAFKCRVIGTISHIFCKRQLPAALYVVYEDRAHSPFKKGESREPQELFFYSQTALMTFYGGSKCAAVIKMTHLP